MDLKDFDKASGFLEKRSKKVSNWKPRYFVYEDFLLRRYSDETESHLLGTMTISSHTTVEVPNLHCFIQLTCFYCISFIYRKGVTKGRPSQICFHYCK